MKDRSVPGFLEFLTSRRPPHLPADCRASGKSGEGHKTIFNLTLLAGTSRVVSRKKQRLEVVIEGGILDHHSSVISRYIRSILTVQVDSHACKIKRREFSPTVSQSVLENSTILWYLVEPVGGVRRDRRTGRPCPAAAAAAALLARGRATGEELGWRLCVAGRGRDGRAAVGAD